MIATQVNDMSEQTRTSRVISAQHRTAHGAFGPRVPERTGAIIAGVIVLALALGIVHILVFGLMRNTPGYVKPEDDNTPYVNVVLPKKALGGGEIFLPGTLHG